MSEQVYLDEFLKLLEKYRKLEAADPFEAMLSGDPAQVSEAMASAKEKLELQEEIFDRLCDFAVRVMRKGIV